MHIFTFFSTFLLFNKRNLNGLDDDGNEKRLLRFFVEDLKKNRENKLLNIFIFPFRTKVHGYTSKFLDRGMMRMPLEQGEMVKYLT